jgi:spermidine synthase
VSEYGTAIALAATMGGMSVGALATGSLLRGKAPERPVRIYGFLELIIGISGLLLGTAFELVEQADTVLYSFSPSLAPLTYLMGIFLTLGVPTIAMGATIPLFGLIAQQFRSSLALLYGLNTIGAACGTMLMALVVIPTLGVSGSAIAIGAVNLCVFGVTRLFDKGVRPTAIERPGSLSPSSTGFDLRIAMLVFVTGFSTFALEVAWFRSLRAAFRSTTDAFAVMLAAVLLALGFAARVVPNLRKKYSSPVPFLALAAVLTIVVTPAIERFDLFAHIGFRPIILNWFMLCVGVLGPPIMLLGIVLPWLLDEASHAQQWARLYAVNTLGAILGALAAAWFFLPTLGFARSAWGVGLLMGVVTLIFLTRFRRVATSFALLAALLTAWQLESGVGRERTLGQIGYLNYQLLEFHEGPEATVSAVEYADGNRALVIDGFQAASEMRLNHYMEWMGRLPMVLHSDPRRALVICFGTGQTANAVLKEGAEHLDVVDLNRAVFQLAHWFPINEGVLEDPRTTPIVMDGRAFLRRGSNTYDVITLEPMPPTFAGVNALYSREFYQVARQRLSDGGVIAQWVPFHLISPEISMSIAATFLDAFDGSVMWLDPVTPTGILVGQKGSDILLPGKPWPGSLRTDIPRDLSVDQMEGAVLLDSELLRKYASKGTIISDDNQRLAYGSEALVTWRTTIDLLDLNMSEISKLVGRPLPRKR